MDCPRCERQKLDSETYESVTVDRCPRCNGLWIDQDELGTILNSREKKFSKELISEAISKAAPGISEAESQTVSSPVRLPKCPRCEHSLRLLNYNYSSGIIVDTCSEGHGIWFDRAELEKLQAHWEHWEKQKAQHGSDWAKDAAAAGTVARPAKSPVGPIASWLERMISGS
ncbi:MAG TPA: zf-TFIIB domain-containing protein [Bdellovibrionota bacterium]|nr:zf-TFIIB domain-containing protein [Bdellovibrionota bacterium]